ncbi:hypothetical protein EsDP_00000777 [Epichloe bromicola]|uniref:Cysteine-rich transmembrane domain-containing protein n=1 Tax=Epichloe bromicola TaxID=79588 RepID=A0ABQ0CGC8_9HYPO
MSSQEYYQGQQGGYPQHPQPSYGPPQGQYPPPQGQYYGPPQGQQPMQYQQAPPAETRGKKGGSNNCLIACLAAICCCCAVEEGCECWYVLFLYLTSYPSPHIPSITHGEVARPAKSMLTKRPPQCRWSELEDPSLAPKTFMAAHLSPVNLCWLT